MITRDDRVQGLTGGRRDHGDHRVGAPGDHGRAGQRGQDHLAAGPAHMPQREPQTPAAQHHRGPARSVLVQRRRRPPDHGGQARAQDRAEVPGEAGDRRHGHCGQGRSENLGR